jgi:hypothetical protein
VGDEARQIELIDKREGLLNLWGKPERL